MKKIMIGMAAGALLLAGCSSSGDNSFEAAQPGSSPAAARQQPGSGPVVETDREAGVGDTLIQNCFSHLPCDAEFTITSLTLTDECSQKYDSYGSTEPDLEPGLTYFEIEGEFVVKSAENGWAMLDDPQFVDAEGFTQLLTPAFYCKAEAPYVDWSNTLDVGQKARHFGAWKIPADASHLLLHDTKIMLASAEQPVAEDVEPALEESAPSPAPAPARTSQAPAPAPAPAPAAPAPRAPIGFTGAPVGEPQPLVGKVIDYCMTGPVQPGSTMFTDGTTGWTTECAG